MKNYKNSTTGVWWGNLQIILFPALFFIISNFSGISQDVRINGIIIDLSFLVFNKLYINQLRFSFSLQNAS